MPGEQEAKWLWQFYLTLRKLAPIFQFAVFVFAVVLAFYFFHQWNIRRDTVVNLSRDTLGTPVETTSYLGSEFEGFESLILTNMKAGSSKQLDLSPKFKDVFREIVVALKNPRKPSFSLRQLERGPESGTHRTLIAATFGKAELCSGQGTADGAFIFVPAMAIHSEEVKHLRDIVPDRVNDITASLASAKAVCGLVESFGNKPLFVDSGIERGAIVQSYFLTSTGLLIIHQAGLQGDKQAGHYQHQFDPYTFLPDRRYFWKAVRSRQADPGPHARNFANADDYKWDSVVGPYFDLGGNGAIQTYCWGFTGDDNPQSPDGALCVDVGYPDSDYAIKVSSITGALAGLDSAVPKEIICDAIQEECENSDRSPADDLTNALRNSDAGFSQVLGQIYVLSKSNPLKFVVPVSINNSENRLLEFTVDLASLQKTMATEHSLGSIFLLVAGIAFATLINTWIIHKRAVRRARDNLNFVMTQVDRSYAMVDPDDMIVEANDEFCKMVKRLPDDLIGKRKLVELLNDDSRKVYAAQARHRERGDHSSYPVTFYNGPTCIVYGAPVPGGKIALKDRPFTFAIFVEDATTAKETPAH